MYVLLLVHWSSCITVHGIIYAITYVKIMHVFITLKAKKKKKKKKKGFDCDLLSFTCTKFANKVVE